MPGQNEFKAFASGVGANTITPSAWAALTALLANGFQAGTASSAQINTVLRQASTAAAGLGQFIANQEINALDDGSPANFASRLLAAIQAATVDSVVPIGFPAMWPASSPPTGWIKRNGALLPRSMYPRLTAAIQAGYLNVVSEAAWPSNPGAFTLGDGATTIRVPDARGLVDKGHHDGSSAFTTNTTRLLSSIEWDDVKSHNHGILMYGQETGTGRVTDGGPPDAGVKYTENTGGPENLIRNASYLPILRAV